MRSGSASLVAAACLLLALSCPLAQAAKTYPLSTLAKAAYVVNVTGYIVDGVQVPAKAPCTNPAFPNSCLPIVRAASDKVVINYAPSPTFNLPSGSVVSIYACYSNVSSFNRPWRANTTKTDVLTDKACHYKIKLNAPAATAGTAAFAPNDESPTSTVIIRAYVYHPKGVPIGFANAPGFIQIQRIPTPSSAIKGGAIGMIVAGPVLLAVGLTLDSFFNKRRKTN